MPFCRSCGAEHSDQAVYCGECGSSVALYQPPGSMVQPAPYAPSAQQYQPPYATPAQPPAFPTYQSTLQGYEAQAGPVAYGQPAQPVYMQQSAQSVYMQQPAQPVYMQQPAQPIYVIQNAAPVPAMPVMSQVNVAVVAPNRPGLFIRTVYFLLIGWWVSIVWVAFALAFMATLIGIPLGVMMLNRLPQVLTLA